MVEELHSWFEENRRAFPWREERTPYKVWVSEVMLQQTRASVAVPYFLRWLELFPDVRILAGAPLEQVIKAWEGLGYYSRARSLHRGAQQVLERYSGELPASSEKLAEITGLGPYTRGAILSFGFQKRAAAVDGNVLRVMSRLFLIEENVSKSAVRQKIERRVEGLLDEERPWVTMEALIELGATLCQPRPRCEVCPLKESCLARRVGRAELLPLKNPRAKTEILTRAVAILEGEELVLVKKGEPGRIMADLYTFPYFEGVHAAQLQKKVENHFGVKVDWKCSLPMVQHSFTRYRAKLYPQQFLVERVKNVPGYEWVEKEKLLTLPFSAGHREIAKEIGS